METTGNTSLKKVLLVSLVVIAGLSLLYVKPYFSFTYIQSQHQLLQQFYQAFPVLSIVDFTLVYVIVSTIGLPGLTILALLSGFIFGQYLEVIIILISFGLHCLCGYYVMRYFFKEWVEKNFGNQLNKIDNGIRENGWMY